jgi:hypothetical protein
MSYYNLLHAHKREVLLTISNEEVIFQNILRYVTKCHAVISMAISIS